MKLPKFNRRKRQADEDERLLAAGLIAFQHTREYIGEDVLPAIPGWSWFDWCERAEARLRSGGGS